jgi:hypothetical protein
MSQFFAAGGVPIQYNTNTSGSFTTPISGKYLITAIGGGGGGWLGENARGGGGGGLAQSLVSLSSGVVLTLTVGAGGAGGNPGTAGGTTTVSGSGITTLTANGGAGGTNSGSTAGGTASGGNIMNVTGGIASNQISSGGGAVGVYGTTPAASGHMVGASAGGALLDIPHSGDGFLGGRLLQPLAGYSYYWDGNVGVMPYPGQGGSGLFSGAGFYTIVGGRFGGGGARGGSGQSAPGGVGGVIIEYFLA